MPSPDNAQPDNALANNELDLTEAEAAAMKPDDAPAGDAAAGDAAAGAADAGKTGDAPAAPLADAPAAPAADADAAAAAAATATADTPAGDVPTASAPAASPPPAVFVPTYAGDQRDFDAELGEVSTKLKDLRTKHGAGDIEDEAYETAYEELQEAKIGLRIEQANARTRAELSQQNADQSWAYLQTQFFADTANTAIRANGILFAAWEAGMQEVVNEAAAEKRAVTDWDVMVGARAKLVAAGMLPGGAAATPAPAAATAPKPDRTPPLGNVPQGLSAAPSAAEPGSRTTTEAMAEVSDIEDIETMLAGKSEAERDAILRGTPGAFLG
ncbi:MAG: hypothetical protein ACREO4_06180 [Lysobacter sp.]